MKIKHSTRLSFILRLKLSLIYHMQCPLNLVLSSLLETLGCRPPYYIGHDNSLPKCLNPQNLKTAFSRTTIQNDTNPCRMIEKVIYTYEKWMVFR